MINSKKKGFTIVELVIVIAVVAILAAVLIPTFSNLVKKANESSDIQAVRNMNVYLAQANATDEVKSILDVYEIFEESEYEVENYQPLYKGRFFYYDKQKNKILYVDENEKILFPADLAGQAQGTNDWFSLSTEIKLEEVTNTTETGSTITYTVNTAGQYAGVVEQLNKGFTKDVTILIDSNLDFKGANITIKEVPNGKSLTIKGNGEGKTLKNITSNEAMTVDNGNATKTFNEYDVAGLIASAKGNVTIENLTFENVNVKQINAGNAAILIAFNFQESDKTVTISNVKILNSTVIGNRNVGALIGNYEQKEGASGASKLDITGVELKNVDVKTVTGFSGLIFGHVNDTYESNVIEELDDITGIDTCTFGVYECELNTGICKGKDCGATCDTDGSDGSIHGYSYEVGGTAKCRESKGVSFSKNALYYGDGK